MEFLAPLNISGARFVGRGADLDGLEALFGGGRRLVTLWATAGMGKTRLATEYALRAHASGVSVAFCDLTECRSQADVVGGVAAVLGSPFASGDLEGEVQRIGRVLAGRPRQLVVLDNFEQVVDVAAQTVARWLSIATRCRFLVTSRERLRLRGEASYELSPLSLPEEGNAVQDSEAVTLFCDRARDLDPDFTLDAENSEALTRLVHRLEGIPLAIELAAARVDVLGVWGLLERLTERLLVLGAGQRDLSPRQATLRGAIAWSWDLLTEDERAGLAHSAVFQGGFTLDAAEAVLDAEGGGRSVLDVLQSLRDKSLLRVGRENRTLRFSHYESVRRFALEALEERETREAAVGRHAAFYAREGGRWAEMFEATGAPVHVQSIAQEMDNLSIMLDRALSDGMDVARANRALHAAVAMGPVLTVQRSAETQSDLLDRVIIATEPYPVDPTLRARVLRARGRARLLRGRLDDALLDYRRAREHVSTGPLGAALTADIGVVHHQQRALDEAMDLYESALAGLAGSEALRLQARIMGNIGAVRHDRGQYDEAITHYRRALGLFAEVGDRRLEGIFLANLGLVELELDRRQDARVHLTRALSALQEVGDDRFTAITMGNLGILSHLDGDLGAVRRFHEGALVLLKQVGDRRSEALCLGRLGAVHASSGDEAKALDFIDRAEIALEQIGDGNARQAVGLGRGFIDLAHASRARVLGRESEAVDRLASVSARIAAAREGAQSLLDRSDDARLTVRLLQAGIRQLGRSTTDAETLSDDLFVVGPEANWIRPPGGEWTDLRRKAAARRVLLRLVEQRHAAPGEGLDIDALRQAGWPGEKMIPKAAKNRVHVTINQLRKLGLRAVVVRGESGYLIDPDAPIQRLTVDPRALTDSPLPGD